MKAFILCCLVAVGLATEVRESTKPRVTRSNCYDQGYPAPAPYMAPAPYSPPAYDTPAYSPPAYPQPPAYPPMGTFSAPPTPIVFHPPKPTVTTILIHNAEAPPPKPSLAGKNRLAALGSGSSLSSPPSYTPPPSYGPPPMYGGYRSK